MRPSFILPLFIACLVAFAMGASVSRPDSYPDTGLATKDYAAETVTVTETVVVPGSTITTTSTTTTSTATWKEPAFCNGLNCPPYQVNGDIDGFEVRTYRAGKWAVDTEEGKVVMHALRDGFMKLFKYIGGNNSDKQKIDMTAPVRAKITAGDGPFCKDTVEVGFYNPYIYQKEGAKVPTPTDNDVSIEESPEMKVVVNQFGGYANDEEIHAKVRELAEVLSKHDIKFNAKAFYFAGYDSPFKFWKRHNEVWVILEN
eukprot:Clim_evm18s66 gene=Clim_evmTU18s66